MKGCLLNGIHTGYVIYDPEPCVPELKHAGEEWAFPEYSTTIHQHAYHELHLQLSGSTEWETGHGALAVERNMLVAMAPGIRHQMRPLSPRAHHFIYCALDLREVLAQCGLSADASVFHQPCFLIRQAEEFAAPFTLLSQEIRQNRPGRAEIIRLTVRAIGFMLHRFATSGEAPGSSASTPFESRHLLHFRRYIEQHLRERITISAITSQLGISRTALFDLCRKELGKSPAAYQMERRMEIARTMLKTPSLPLTQIALELGFSSSQHFSTAFRKHFGVAPSGYRTSPHLS